MKRWLLLLAKGGLSVGLIAWVLSNTDLASAWEHAKNIDPGMLVLSILLMFLQIIHGTLRWGLILRALSSMVRWGTISTIYLVSLFFLLILPGAIGSDMVRMWLSRKSGVPLATSIHSVFFERAITVISLVLLVCVTQPILQQRVPELPGSWVFPLLLLGGVVGILVLCYLDRLPPWLREGWLRGFVTTARDSRVVFLNPRWNIGLLIFSIAGHVNLSLVIYVLAMGLDLNVHFLDCLVLVPPVILVMTLPLSISGWGVREAAMVTAFGYVDVSNEAALVLSIVFGLVSMLTVLPGGLLFLLLKKQEEMPHEER